MSDAKRYKAALVSQYSDVVLAIDHETALAAKDARIAELEAYICYADEVSTCAEQLLKMIQIDACDVTKDMVAVFRLDAALKELESFDNTCADGDATATPSKDGGDEREQFEAHMQSASFNDHDWFRRHPVRTDEYDNPGMQSDWVLWQARAALAPAAVVMPERRTDANYPTQLWREAAGWNAALDEVARLNRRAIPVEELEALRRDAGRWRAFINCARIKFFGWAGYTNPDPNGNDPKNYRHFGGEFWSIHEAPTADKEKAHEILNGFADAAIAQQQELRALLGKEVSTDN